MTTPDLTVLRRRESAINDWLKLHAPEVVTEQKHLDDGSVERAY